MTDHTTQNLIPEYLQELLEDKPSGDLKLIAAWDGLSVETQIKIIHSLIVPSIIRAEIRAVSNELKNKILSSENDYVRYLFIKHSHFSERNPEDQKILCELSHAENPIVKYAAKTGLRLDNFFKNPASLFSMPEAEQLAYIAFTYASQGGGNQFANLLKWALENNAADEKHLARLTEEYLKNLKKTYDHKEEVFGYWGSADKEDQDQLRDFQVFFDLVINFPTKSELIETIIFYLPGGRGAYSEIETTLIKMDQKYLELLLRSRQDASLEDFRKKILFNINGDFNEQIRIAAATNIFEVTPEEFHALIRENKQDILKILIKAARTLPPVYYSALYDINNRFLNEDNKRDCWGCDIWKYQNYGYFFRGGRSPQDRKFSWDDKKEIERELIKLALYEIAVAIVPWDKNKKPPSQWRIDQLLSGELNGLKSKIIGGDPWATYMAFAKEFFYDPRLEEFCDDYPSEACKQDLLNRVRRGFPRIKHLVPCPEELFGKEGREANFTEDKIDYLYREISSIKLIVDDIVNAFKALRKNLVWLVIIFFVVWGISKIIH